VTTNGCLAAEKSTVKRFTNIADDVRASKNAPDLREWPPTSALIAMLADATTMPDATRDALTSATYARRSTRSASPFHPSSRSATLPRNHLSASLRRRVSQPGAQREAASTAFRRPRRSIAQQPISGSIDENSKEIGVALLMLARVSEATGATIIVLHHNRKPQKDQIGGAKMAISGSSSIPGGSESIFVMSADKGGPIVVEHERTPLGKKLATFGLRIEDVGEGNDPRSGLRVVHMEGEQLSREDEASKAARVQRDVARAVDAILTTLRKGGGGFKGSRKDLRAVSGVGEVPFSHALASLLTSGDVLKRGTYHEPEWHLPEG
jgi:hypothetical protein